MASLAVRTDTLTTLTPANGDYVNIRTDQWGNLWTSLGTKLDSTNDSVTADTELPAAATIAADGVTPTVPGVANYNFIKTPGANTWDRAYSVVNATNSTGTGITAAGILAQFDDSSPTSITENQFGNVRMSANRNLYHVLRDSAGNERGANVNAENALTVSVVPSATNGASTMNATSSDGGTALTSTAQVIKASAGTLKGYYIYNPNSIAQFVEFYNTAAASVTVGTTNPLFMLTIPATSAANLWATDGIAFSNAGWSWAATSSAGGSGSPSTALDAVAFYV